MFAFHTGTQNYLWAPQYPQSQVQILEPDRQGLLYSRIYPNLIPRNLLHRQHSDAVKMVYMHFPVSYSSIVTIYATSFYSYPVCLSPPQQVLNSGYVSALTVEL